MRQKFVAGNWKMHGSKASVEALMAGLIKQADQAGAAKIAVCPPSLYIDQVVTALRNAGCENIAVGAQNMTTEPDSGAFTGEISARMLKDVGCEFVILGHSERRAMFAETNEVVAEKVKTALENDLTPILCIGETLAEREAGKLEAVISEQVEAVLSVVGIDAFAKIVIAYEPVWAIGTGKTASADQAQEVHAFIRSLLAKSNPQVAEKVVIQYGGSMKPANAQELMAQPDIDGGLIGGASLKAEDFIAICQAAGA
ncbi:MAG: triose-phosphate isomerase [Hydrogenovibrio sp.]|uniref:triose-phosphate isomerase n=1 Tax=Hydrogenovibrio sp. TaxID=2065821 RepID=UPI00286FFF2E|nr:triose-phosphate isomerase [Hydrogenovibrio sp.]MDR9499439.1 triose-phosphate isomerase [Hydrogenovibrio sp.]